MTADPSRGLPPIDLWSRLERLRRYGEREAYLWRDGVRWRSRTYSSLHERILGCAAVLSEAGVTSGVPVLVQGPNHPDWVEALLGVFLVGGVAVPLDEGTPEAFRSEVARRSGSRLLVAPPGIEPPEGCRRLDFGSWRGLPGTPAAGSGADLDRTAEIVFTSGTTGEPRGVVLTHRNLASDFAPVERAFLKREFLIRPLRRRRFLSTLPLSHMFGQAMNVFLPLFMGLTVVFVPPRPREIREAARRTHPWGLFTVPRLLDLLSEELRREVRERGKLEAFEKRRQRCERWPFYLQALLFWPVQRRFGWRFRLFVIGGAPLPESLQQFWENCGYLLVQGYGLTETAPIVSISNPFDRRAGSVGRPLSIQEVKLGAGGEVLVRGPNVTPGYFGAGSAEAATEWFHTGDVGEFDEKGRLRIRGRMKDVIVTAEGENVHAVDVEAAFNDLPGVREACVIGLPYEGGERVHAVLRLEPGTDAEECVRAANAKLQPKQRVRDYTLWGDEDFPRTPTGKVRKGIVRDGVLAQLREGSPAAAGAPRASGSVRRLVARVARVPSDRLDETTPLVEGLGLASLDLVELAMAFEEEFGIALPEDLLSVATVGDLERSVRQFSSGVGLRQDPAAPPAASDEPPAFAERTHPVRPGSLRMPRWAHFAPLHLLRRILEEVLFRPFVTLYARPEVVGLEHLREAEPPFLFVANHRSYLDTALFKVALPRSLRGRIAPGMTTRYHRVYFGEAEGGWTRYWKERLQVRLLELLFGAWPLPETAGFRQSLSYAGELADDGFSILIFPEGRHVREGAIEPFRKGIGIFARDLRAPVIPAYLVGTARVLPDRVYWPRFGRTRLVLGRPLRIAADEDPAETTRRLEEVIHDLRDRASRPGPS